MITENDIVDFLTVKCGCTIDELVCHINTVYSHFKPVSFLKEDIEKTLVRVCQQGYPFYLEKLVDSTDAKKQVWGVFRCGLPTHKRFAYGT